jgi:hypothetical protein
MGQALQASFCVSLANEIVAMSYSACPVSDSVGNKRTGIAGHIVFFARE